MWPPDPAVYTTHGKKSKARTTREGLHYSQNTYNVDHLGGGCDRRSR